MSCNTITNKSLLILQFNANGLKNHALELQTVLYNKHVDIALITETHLTKYSTIHIPGYKLLKTNHPDGTAHGGVAILIKSTILFELLPNFCLDHLQSCTIIVKLNNIPITIAAIYSPPKHKITVQNYTNYFNTVGNNFIIGGDFNAKHHSWGCRANNPRGSVLHNFVSQKNFKVLAPPGPTYWPTSVRKNPDILDIFIAKILSNIHCNTINILDLNSDHSSVILTLNASPPLRPISPKLFNRTTHKLQFHELVDQRIQLNVKLKSKDDLDSAVNNFTNIIQSSAWSSSKQTTPPSNLSPMPAHIREVIVQKRRARAHYQRSRLPSLKQMYNKLSNSLKKLLAKHKSNSFTSYLTNLSSTDGSLWRATKNVCKTKTPNIPIKKPDGSLAVTDSDKTEAFKQHLSDIFVPHSDIFCPHNINSVEEFLNVPLPACLPVKHFTPNEVKYTIDKYPLKKSPGFDLITAEVARCLPKKAIIHLTHIFNSVLRLSYFPILWKYSIIILVPKPNKPPDSISSFRPISLLPFFAKVLERLLLKRILPSLTTNSVLPDYQFGFRSAHSTIHQAHRVVDSISFALEKKSYCTCAFLDISQAFDRVWHDGLLFKLKKFLHPVYFLIIKSYLSDRYFSTRIGDTLSSIARISAGVPQGGILSPVLYNIYASDQPITPHTQVADYADDKVIISISPEPITASSHLQNHLTLMKDWYTKWRLKINQSKSVHTTFTLRLSPCPAVSIYGTHIPNSQTVKYLGLTLDRRLTWAQHTKLKRLNLNSRFRLLKSFINNNTHTNLNTKLLIYKSLIKPVWTYGIQLWGNAKKSNLNKIQTFQNLALRKLLNAPPYVSNSTIHSDLKMKTVHEEAKIHYKRFHSRLSSNPNPLIRDISTNSPLRTQSPL